MWPRLCQILDPLTKADSGHKCRKIFCNGRLQYIFKELKSMVSDDTLLGYQYWTITFIFHTDASYKKLDAGISKNNKPIELFSIILGKPQRNYTITENELFAIVQCLNQFRGIIFGY